MSSYWPKNNIEMFSEYINNSFAVVHFETKISINQYYQDIHIDDIRNTPL